MRNTKIVCVDGFSMSVQANKGAYCEPRIDNATKYTAVEVGYPSEEEPLLMSYAEDASRPTDTVYGWVPTNVVSLVIAKHGGMIEGQVPAGVPELWTTS